MHFITISALLFLAAPEDAGRGNGHTSEELIPALVRLPDAAAVMPMLEAAGVRFRRGSDGRARRAGSVYPVDASARTLTMLATMGWSVQVGRPDIGEPTQVIGTEAGTWPAQAYGPTPLDGPTGRDITVLSIDSGIDVFHPHFFRADGGAHPWVDVDGDGRLVPGVDGIDANSNGTLEPNELFVLLDHANEATGDLDDGEFDPAIDYLYLDLNGNGRRDHGPAFGESAPSYGEPVFLPDDADGDGVIDVHERVLLLKTSKISAFRHGDQVWRRGVDLVELPMLPQSTAMHGTATSGILVGGQDRLFRRHRGLAGDVDIVMASSRALVSWADFVEAYAWGIEEGAQIMLHEYSSYSGHELDGSTLADLAIDESSASVVHVCPAGNLASGQKHVQTTAQPAVFEVDVPAGMLEWFRITLHWRDPTTELACSLRNPSGNEVGLAEGAQTIPPTTVFVDRWNSLAQTAVLDVFVQAPAGQHPGSGAWTLTCTHSSATPLDVHAYLRDPVSFWNPYTRFVQPLPDPSSTMCWPSTAAGCITLGAYEFQVPFSVEAGDLGLWSSRGPRLDGGRTIDLAAPRDAYSPLAGPYGGSLDSTVRYFLLGGTSAAAPVVVAAVAQLLEREPGLSSADVRERLRASAGVDEFVDLQDAPDDGWGYGKLRAHEALYGQVATPAPDFITRDLEVTFESRSGECTARVRVHDVDWASASFRWDDDYDGTWDTEFDASPQRAIVIDPAQPSYALRVEMAAGGWRVGGGAISGDVPESCFRGVEPDSDTEDTDGDPSLTSGSMTDDPSSGTGETDGTPGTDSSTDGGCSCTTTPTQAHGWWAILLVAWRRRP